MCVCNAVASVGLRLSAEVERATVYQEVKDECISRAESSEKLVWDKLGET